jgi:hypothetical protein
MKFTSIVDRLLSALNIGKIDKSKALNLILEEEKSVIKSTFNTIDKQSSKEYGSFMNLEFVRAVKEVEDIAVISEDYVTADACKSYFDSCNFLTNLDIDFGTPEEILDEYNKSGKTLLDYNIDEAEYKSFVNSRYSIGNCESPTKILMRELGVSVNVGVSGASGTSGVSGTSGTSGYPNHNLENFNNI